MTDWYATALLTVAWLCAWWMADCRELPGVVRRGARVISYVLAGLVGIALNKR
jgi:hypothetical protein